MKKKILFVCAVFILCLGLFPVHRVYAASYVSGEPQGNATIAKVGKISVKVENRRLFARSGNEEWTYLLMDSKLSSNIVTNGSRVYYAINAKADGKSKIYSLSVKTGKQMLVKKVKADSISIQGYYGGKLFYNAVSSGSAAVYDYDIKEKKSRRIQKDMVIVASYMPYLVLKQVTDRGIGKLSAYNCKTGLFRTITSECVLNKSYVSGKYLYYRENSNTAQLMKVCFAQEESVPEIADEVYPVVSNAGNCDDFIGLSSRYWVMATARKTVKVYSKKSTSAKVLGKFTVNNCVVADTTGMKKGVNYQWLKVKLSGSKKGYVKYTDVSLEKLNVKTFGLSTSSKKNRTRIKICRYGLPYIGIPYVLGGYSFVTGTDCSIFARTAMRACGVKVSNRALARDLARCGKNIRRSQLKPGDMIFYYNSHKDHTIGHCVIYIGNGFIINEAGNQGTKYPSGGMRISKIDYREPTAVVFRNLVG